MKSKRRLLVAAVLAASTLAVACSGGAAEPAEPAGKSDSVAVVVTEAPTLVTEAPTLHDGLPGFSRANVGWNGYWYSRYNLGALAMMSGLGLTFEPPAEAIAAMIGMADARPGEGEDVPALKNPVLLAAVFASADPHFAAPHNGDPLDLANGRLDPATFDRTITPAAQAMLMTKAAEWAKFFFTESWSGTADGDIGALDRFKGLALFAGAKMQAKFALEKLRDEDGLFIVARHEDGELVRGETAGAYDQYVMVMALSDVLTVLEHPERWQGTLRDDAARDMLREALDGFYGAVSEQLTPTTVQELSWAARADVWFASITRDPELRRTALANLREHADALVAAQPSGIVDRARRIRGAIEAARILDDDGYRATIADDFVTIAEAFDPVTGGFSGIDRLLTAEVADLIGALNAVSRFGAPQVNPADVDAVLVPFYEAAVNLGGLQMSAPPPQAEASPFELERFAGQAEFFAYPSIPTPGEAGGIAPLAASELSFSNGRWAVSDTRFDSHGGMYLSNEEFWLLGIVSGFPEVDSSAVALLDDGEIALRELAATID